MSLRVKVDTTLVQQRKNNSVCGGEAAHSENSSLQEQVSVSVHCSDEGRHVKSQRERGGDKKERGVRRDGQR